jgi:hypothetical protein
MQCNSRKKVIGRPPAYTPDENGLYDVVRCLGEENMEYFWKDPKFRVNNRPGDRGGGTWYVSRTSLFRLKQQLKRLKQQYADANESSSDEESNVADAETVAHDDDETASDQPADVATAVSSSDSSNNESLLSSDDADAVLDMESGGDATVADTNGSPDNDDDDSNINPAEEIDEEAAVERNNVELKENILQLLEEQTRREREAENDSSSDSVYFNSDDDRKSTTSHSDAVKKKKTRTPRPVIVAEFEADNNKSNEVVVVDDENSSNDEETLPVVIPINEMIGNNQYTADDLFTDNLIVAPAAAANDPSAINGELLQAEKSKGKKKSMQTLLKLQTEAQIKFIQQQDFKGNVTWTNVMKHLGYLLDLTQADMTVTLQFFKASGLDPALQKLPETGKVLLEPKRYNMKKARKEFQYVYLLS